MSSRREKEIKERLHPILAQLRTNHGHNGAVAWGPHKRQAENLRALAAEEMAIIADFIDRRFSWVDTKRPDAFSMACDILSIYSLGTRWRTHLSSVPLDPHAMAELLAKNKTAKAVREALRVAIVNAALAIE